MEEQKEINFKDEVIKNLRFLMNEGIINIFDLESCENLLDLHRKISERFSWEAEKEPKIPNELWAFYWAIDEAENGYPL